MAVLSNYQINGMCRTFHEYLEKKKFDVLDTEIIQKYGLEFLTKTKNRSLISLILKYGINTDNYKIISTIFPSLTMKRDYLNLIVYYNENRENIDIDIDEIFKKYIPFDSILPEDIEYLIENNLGYLIKYLDGKFIQLNHNLYFPDHITYKKYPFVNSMKYFIELSTKINPNEFDKFNDVIKTNNYKYIIDAGNIIHSRNGMFTEESILDLQTVVNNFKDSLIIIHKMHLKNARIMEFIADKLYYPTPYKCNDDIFIILAYLANNCKIISNDNYKDHTIDNTEMRNFIFDDLVKFKNINGNFTFEKELEYSRCIQVIEENVYIPYS